MLSDLQPLSFRSHNNPLKSEGSGQDAKEELHIQGPNMPACSKSMKLPARMEQGPKRRMVQIRLGKGKGG